jgi:hypothetical protein
LGLCYNNCGRLGVLSIMLAPKVWREACPDCYEISHAPGNRISNRQKGTTMLCHDKCGRRALVVLHGQGQQHQDIVVCVECADVRRLVSLQEHHPQHTGHVTGPMSEDMLNRLASAKDDFTRAPPPPGVQCLYCGIVMSPGPATTLLYCSMCNYTKVP